MQHNKIIQACQEFLQLPQAEPVRTYLNGRLSKQAQEKFLFGYFPNYNELHLLVDKVGEDILVEYHLLYRKFIQDGILQRQEIHSPLEEHNLVLPYRDVYGNVVSLVGRTIVSEEERKERKLAKYKNTSFKKGNHLFGLFEARQDIIKKGYAIICEGQFDAIKAFEKGVCNIVAVGSSNMTFDQFTLVNRYTNNIFIIFDNDNAGEIGASKILNDFGKYANIKICKLPQGFKDIDEVLSAEIDIKHLLI